MGIREFQPGYTGTSSRAALPATGGTSSAAGQAHVMFTSGTLPARRPAGQSFAARALPGHGAPTAGSPGPTEPSAPDITGTLMFRRSAQPHHGTSPGC
jgi:hypothetical protein